ncbi:uncharacterized protein C8R40DRAFT_1109846 [Lentinula edodes]|uniref:uncharacterized protein n=1 Tax=Lentinula edodes TaxID=5353 RepID=UPI001E8D489F|nr:uncharacterized protein C8R40DRAFT_1109846 [Lentinula edodes]KAH7874216.1 hypothetical protein C8R40DRAFT_1109846 [Lentinula edodes]
MSNCAMCVFAKISASKKALFLSVLSYTILPQASQSKIFADSNFTPLYRELQQASSGSRFSSISEYHLSPTMFMIGTIHLTTLHHV